MFRTSLLTSCIDLSHVTSTLHNQKTFILHSILSYSQTYEVIEQKPSTNGGLFVQGMIGGQKMVKGRGSIWLSQEWCYAL